jgi:hypothetical protein
VTGPPPAALQAPSLEPVTAKPTESPVTSAEEQVSLEAAKTAVLELLKAESQEAILARILNPEKEASKIREHYGVRPIEALQLTSIRPESTGLMPDGKKRYIFVVETPAKAAAGAPPSTGTVKFFISAAETPDGFRVPWDLYIECRERRFSRFVSDAEYPPTAMRILIKRDHYFGADIRSVDSMHCFKISSANPDDPTSHAFVPRNSTLAAELEKTVKWDQNYFLVATLEHISKDGDSFIQIREVNQWGWFEN